MGISVSIPAGLEKYQSAGVIRSTAHDGYDAARYSPYRVLFAGMGGAADNHLSEMTHWQLMEQCRDNRRNSPLINGAVKRTVENVVGTEFRCKATSKEKKFNKIVDDYIKRRWEKCDARDRTDFHGILQTVLASRMTDGDILLVHTDKGKIRIVEADQIVTPLDKGTRKIINGMELDNEGRAIGFWLSERKHIQHGGFVDDPNATKRIDAKYCTFAANIQRSSQTRGEPDLASCLPVYENFNKYLMAETNAAWAQANYPGVIERDPAAGWQMNKQLMDQALNNAQNNITLSRAEQVDPNSWPELFPGEKLTLLKNERPSDTFEPYLRTVLRIIGVPIGLPLELILLDFSQTSFSSGRLAVIQSQLVFGTLQKWLINSICNPVRNRWIRDGIASGELPVVPDAFACKWYPPKWPYVDKLKEIQADVMAIKAGLLTISEIAERRGITVEELVEEFRREVDLFDGAGLIHPILQIKNFVKPKSKPQERPQPAEAAA